MEREEEEEELSPCQTDKEMVVMGSLWQVSIAVLLENFLRACNESKLEEKVATIKAKQASTEY